MMGVALTSVLALAACGQQTEDDKGTNQSVNNNADVAQLKPNFKLVGDDSTGYVQIPSDFVLTPNGLSNTTQYLNPEQTIAVTNIAGDGSVSIEETIESVEAILASSGGEEGHIKDVIIGGNEAVELYTVYPESDYYGYTYFLEDEGKLKAVTIEFFGNQVELKDEIISTFSLDKPNF